MGIIDIKILKVGKTRQREFLTVKGGSLCNIDFPALVGLLIHDEIGPILFDTGYDQEFFNATANFPEKFYSMVTPVTFDKAQSLPMQLEKLNIKKGEIKAIILSHFHGDHIAGLKNFPNAKIYCAKDGLNAARDGSRIQLTRHGFLPKLLPEDIANRAIFFEDGKIINLGTEFLPFESGIDIFGDGSCVAIELKGHCRGHYGLIARINHNIPYVFVGDAAWSIKAIEDDFAPPKMITDTLGNTDVYRATLKKLNELSKLAHGRVEIIPSHCEKTANRLLE